MQPELQQWISITGRLLGTLFYFEPNSEQAQKVLSFFNQSDWAEQLGVEPSAEINQLLASQTDLAEQHQAMFIGPNTLIAPPWGSVYLDPESVIFGNSLLELRAFLRQHQIEFSLNLAYDEPEDHIGLMLLLSAYLAENNPELLNTFLSQHFFTWSKRYLQLASEQTEYPFYQGLALLTQQVLQVWQEQLLLIVPNVTIYR